MIWPTYFPKKCPPEDSINTNGEVYRLVSGKVPKKEDFLSYWIKYPEKRAKYKENKIACEVCGLSVLRTLEDAQRLTRRIRHLPKNIVVANLDSSKGRIKNTFNVYHYTWWIPISVENPSGLFKVVA